MQLNSEQLPLHLKNILCLAKDDIAMESIDAAIDAHQLCFNDENH